MAKEIYLDNAAATPIDGRVKKEMARVFNIYANPSSFNDAGRRARKEINTARVKVGRFLGAHPEEIFFMGSASEANNTAIAGTAKIPGKGEWEILTTPIEHLSVLEPIKSLAPKFRAVFLKVNNEGVVDLHDLKQKLSLKTFLISIMYANNEIGTIEPIKKIAKVIRDFKKEIGSEIYPLFHTDACQAAEYLDVNVNNLGADLLTFNGSKIYGPRGIGVLYVRKGTLIAPLIFGGEHERGLRAGTENLPAIVGLAKAVELIPNEAAKARSASLSRTGLINPKESRKVAVLRDYFLKKIIEKMPEIKINGALGGGRLPNNINISIPGTNSEKLLLELDKYEIRAGSGSACASHAVEPSHVLKAIGVKESYINGVLRFSLGRRTTKKDTEYVLKILQKIVKKAKRT
ncbi:MAG: Cysteine desulfurase [Candidatus Yanofskybacteria bacterium GW2011_GWA2_41_22]|uniref:Aminotransferase class V domain-containing protein n=5 Tax=Parcubacteria group TaxID=1794811 RepID=A0A1F8HVX9_9BACT|nr:MAG: Cysteine desulfurase [Candidatus Yanofskybacteria bacterium GW2011_GWA2_41_22]KKS25112.1 MAG: Cysteine desulfurase [Candidatus Yanofskybacteria bacterium GW2011_GWC2_41_9]KKS25408.1 MAG: Cysteine desulfurase [Candidatus Jorgensenbacteria bacterium GW2011_GWF2_41_8]OGN00245.1 MAG: hypothetical protein A2736_02185 [Candidatus Yanofskybacteria bacterium RIFCSPHIGHO2_01_FULL_41_27]OGN09711.1 MAG: hypothetical protein A3C64_00150 [Candidatus Yanofskybacteria bacterium RIFCSPHIGHO2_02_FULL_41